MAVAVAPFRKVSLTTWEAFWYVLQCISFGAGYFVKVPVKKALQDFGLAEMTGAEKFWYVIECIFFGSGYFAKVPIAKALSELPQYRSAREASLGTLGAAKSPAPSILPPEAPALDAADASQVDPSL